MKTWVKWIGPCLLVLLAAMGGLALGRQLAENVTTEARNDLSLSERDAIATRALNRKLKAENASLTKARSEAGALVAISPEASPRVESLEQLNRLQQIKAVAVRLAAVQHGTIYPGFAKLFGLTEAEVARLNHALQQIPAGLKEPVVSAANMSIVNGAVVVQVPASEDGPRQRQKLLDEFAATLGPERFAALTAMSGIQSIDLEFDAFGGAARQITIVRMEPGPSNRFGFRLSDSRRTSNGVSTGSMTFFSDPFQLPERYRWLNSALPPLTDLQPPKGTIRLSPPAENK